MVEKGLLLPSRQGQRSTRNVFAEELAKYLAERHSDAQAPTASPLVAQVESLQDESPVEPVPTKPARKKRKR